MFCFRSSPGQVPEASDFLSKIEHVEVEPRVERRAVGVAYDLHQHSCRSSKAPSRIRVITSTIP